jgi:hypothetical protein
LSRTAAGSEPPSVRVTRGFEESSMAAEEAEGEWRWERAAAAVRPTSPVPEPSSRTRSGRAVHLGEEEEGEGAEGKKEKGEEAIRCARRAALPHVRWPVEFCRRVVSRIVREMEAEVQMDEGGGEGEESICVAGGVGKEGVKVVEQEGGEGRR